MKTYLFDPLVAVCSVEGCGGRHEARGWCAKHYQRWKKYGDPTYLPTRSDRFWSKVTKTDSCWLWAGARNDNGYGQFWSGSALVYAHRFSYELAAGRPIPGGLQIDHLCFNPACVHPGHLEAVEPAVNIRRQRRPARKTHCRKGHLFDGLKSNGWQRCTICERERNRAWRAAVRGRSA